MPSIYDRALELVANGYPACVINLDQSLILNTQRIDPRYKHWAYSRNIREREAFLIGFMLASYKLSIERYGVDGTEEYSG